MGDPTFRPAHGWRVVADPDALDVATAGTGGADTLSLRLAPDEVMVFGAGSPIDAPMVGDDHAVIDEEHGFHVAHITAEQLADIAAEHIEWAVPRVGLGQGQVAAVPAKILALPDGTAAVVTASACVDELAARLGWEVAR